MLQHLVERFKKYEDRIQEWFSFYLQAPDLQAAVEDPVYCSVDLRNGGYKIAPVDTNIFPGGFNNLCPSFRHEGTKLFKEYFAQYFSSARRIVILAEEHTRNPYYFDNLIALKEMVAMAGFEVEIASLSNELTEEATEFKGTEGKTVKIWRAHITGYLLSIAPWKPDAIIINNDFSAGVPANLKRVAQPLLPTPWIGWHSRKKSDHFIHYNKLADDFSKLIDIDSWLIKTEFAAFEKVDFNSSSRMAELAARVDEVLGKIRPKFQEYGIKQNPYVFVKNDAGTYGMAVMTASSGDEFLSLNKKQRAHMKMGKGKRLVTDVIIQEGIPTVDRFKEFVAEPVMYLIAHSVCGGFFRLHETVDERGNLNQPGVKFSKLCFHETTGYSSEYTKECDLECLRMIYKNISRIASIAAGCEIKKVKYHETTQSSLHH